MVADRGALAVSFSIVIEGEGAVSFTLAHRGQRRHQYEDDQLHGADRRKAKVMQRLSYWVL